MAGTHNDSGDISVARLVCIAFIVALVGYFFVSYFSKKPAPIEPKINIAKINEDLACNTVQQSESSFSGTKIIEAISGLLTVSKSLGNLVEIVGWYATQRYVPGKEKSGHDVYFAVLENGTRKEMQWIVTEDLKIYPVNELAKSVTKATR